jgi:hypothetical protein
MSGWWPGDFEGWSKPASSIQCAGCGGACASCRDNIARAKEEQMSQKTSPPIGSRRTITVGEDRLTAEERADVDLARDKGVLRALCAIIDRLAPEPPRKTLETVTCWQAMRAACEGKDVWRDGELFYHGVREVNLAGSHPFTGHYEIEVESTPVSQPVQAVVYEDPDDEHSFSGYHR